MKKYFDPVNSRLIFAGQSATAEFWARRWQETNLKQVIERDSRYPFFADLTNHFLPAGPQVKVLDGGCGQGSVVLSLQRAGYDAYGVDYAADTVTAVTQLYPQLNLLVADANHLPFSNASFAGYWSLGVIEHYWDGYQSLVKEMYRVLQHGGWLFLTFPYVSPLRSLKARLNLYPQWGESKSPDNFYQFALNYSSVIKDITAAGFVLRYHQTHDGLKGLKEEIPGARAVHTWASKNSTPIRQGIEMVAQAVTPWCGHIRVCVFQKKDI
jgi:SAM-dependent methyltransferase